VGDKIEIWHNEEMPYPKAIIFDCDGVLIDSEHAHFRAWQHAFALQNGLLTLEKYRTYVGYDIRATAKLAAEEWPFLSAEKLLADKIEHYDAAKKNGLPSIESTVDFLKKHTKKKRKFDLKIGVASASRREDIDCHLIHLGIQDCFDLVVSGFHDLQEYQDPEGTNKPKPYIYLEVAKLLNLNPEECVAIEDSRTGILSAIAAGFITIALPNSFTLYQDLKEAHLTLQTLDQTDIEHFLYLCSQAK